MNEEEFLSEMEIAASGVIRLTECIREDGLRVCVIFFRDDMIPEVLRAVRAIDEPRD